MDFSLCLFLYRREIRDGEFYVMCWLYIKVTRWSFWLLITDLFFSFLKNKTAVVCCYLHVLRFTGLEAWNILVNRNKFLWTFDMILEFCYSLYRFLFVVVICFILTLFWIFAHLLSLVSSLKIGANWLSIVYDISMDFVFSHIIKKILFWFVSRYYQEYGYNIVASILYFTAFIVQLAVWAPAASYFTNSNVAAGVILCTMHKIRR
jgi:hypothetical protein